MAKVMISLPDELLEQLDRRARDRGTTRSGLLQSLAQRELTSSDDARREQVQRLLSTARGHGGDAAQHVRRQRQER